MIEEYLRPTYQVLFVDPVTARLASKDISPLHVTICACLFGVIGAVLVALGFSLSGLCLLLLSGYLDTVDGSLARIKECTSPIGAVVDIISDRLVEFAVVLSLYHLHQNGYIALLMLGAILICVTSFLVIGIFSQNSSYKSFHYSPGLMERGEAFFFFSVMIVFPNYFIWLAGLFAALVFLTAIVRVYQFYLKSLSYF